MNKKDKQDKNTHARVFKLCVSLPDGFDLQHTLWKYIVYMEQKLLKAVVHINISLTYS